MRLIPETVYALEISTAKERDVMSTDVEVIKALDWKPSPPQPATIEFAMLAWDFEKPTPAYTYEVELPSASFDPLYYDFVSAAYAAALYSVGELRFPASYGESPGILKRFTGLFPGTERGTEIDEIWDLAVAWEFDTWLERILRINGGDVVAARELIEGQCPVPNYIASHPTLKTELLNYPDDDSAPDLRLLLRWMGRRGWNDDRVRKIVQEHSIMLNDWGKTSFAQSS